MTDQPETIIVIPAYLRVDSDLELLRDALDSIYATTPEPHHVVVIDNASPNRALADSINDLLWGGGELIGREKSDFSGAVNIGLEMAHEQGADCVLMNADVKLTHVGWLTAFRDSPAGITGALLLFPNGLIQHAGVFFSVLVRDFDHIYRFAPGDLPEAQKPRQCPVTAALMHVDYDTIDKLGFFDEEFPLGWEDVDYCIRALRDGIECRYDPSIVAIHHEQAFRRNATDEIIMRQMQSWQHLWDKHKGETFAGHVPIMLTSDEGWYDD